MIDFDILRKYGSTKERIKEVFTCVDPTNTSAYEARKDFEERISSRIDDGQRRNLAAYQLYAAADLAWDSAPILKENVPLMLYAQKKIKLDSCASQLESLGCADKFVVKDEAGTIKDINLPRLYEVSVNLVRSYLTRRVAAQATRFTNLYPQFKYEPRSTSLVGKLRGDALSQRIEMIVDQYGYRHLQTQAIRDMFLYSRAILFPACSWETQKQFVCREVEPGLEGDEVLVESKITKEGVPYVLPHQSRVFWDTAYPMSSLNTDTGATYCGFWDVRKFRDIAYDPAYFNRKAISFSDRGAGLYNNYAAYFGIYYADVAIKFPNIPPPDDGAFGLAEQNDRKSMSGLYSENESDSSVLVTEYFEKVIPKDAGLGSYPYEVWLRLVVASDKTVIYGEFLPSIPAVYFGYNENDSRQNNISLAHELMPFQDQISNLLSQMLMTAKTDLLKLVMLDIDMLDDKHRAALEKTLASKDYYVHPILVEYSGTKARNMGQAPNPISIQSIKTESTITEHFRAISNLLSIVERMMVLSPQELGQPAPREISATEVTEIAASTNTVYSFIADAIDEGRAAWKKQLYESLIALGGETIQVPVINRYTEETIKAAKFELVTEQGAEDADPIPKELEVRGTKKALIHEYIFSSRDGAERSSNQQAAQTLTQLVGQLFSMPELVQAIGKKRIYEMLNEIFRLSGSGYDLKLELEDGEDTQIGPSPDQIQQLAQAVQQMAQQVNQQGQQLEQVIQVTQAMLNPSVRPGASQPTPATIEPPAPAGAPLAPPPPPELAFTQVPSALV